MAYTIVYTISSSGVFGAENIVINEARILREKGFRIGFVLIHPQGDNVFLDKIKELGFSCHHLVSNRKFDFGAIFKLKNILKREKCNLVHSNKYKADIISLIAARMMGIPIITTVHGWCSEDLKARIYEKMQAFSWRFFNQVICVSEFYRQKALSFGVSKDKVTVVHNSIVTGDYKTIQSKGTYLLDKYGIPADHFVIGIIGRLSLEKGHCYFIEAANKLAQKIPNISFVIAGDGKEKQNIKELIDKFNLEKRVYMLGHIKNIKEIYALSNAVVISSLREGLPTVLLEAMLYGIPVVATRVGGIPEVIQDKIEGLLVPAEDSQAIADSLESLICNYSLRKKIVSAAREKVLNQFSFEKRMLKIKEICKEAIGV